MMRVVFDTSVILAAFLKPSGTSNKLLKHKGPYTICSSSALIQELVRKLRDKEADEKTISSFLNTYLSRSVICDDSQYTVSQVANDYHLVGCLEKCRADLIVTLDRKRLRKLKNENVPAVHVSQFRHYFPKNM